MQGDSFLKYFSSVYVFVFNPALSEGALHKARQHLISNKVLKQCGLAIGLPSYIQGKAFSYKMWQPPNFTVQGISLQHPGRSNDVALSGGDDEMTVDISQSMKTPVDGTNTPVMHLASQSRPRPNTLDDSITQWLGDKVKWIFSELELSNSHL
jgi:endoribonuclease Dicer